jgi:hypothetical protein
VAGVVDTAVPMTEVITLVPKIEVIPPYRVTVTVDSAIVRLGIGPSPPNATPHRGLTVAIAHDPPVMVVVVVVG